MCVNEVEDEKTIFPIELRPQKTEANNYIIRKSHLTP